MINSFLSFHIISPTMKSRRIPYPYVVIIIKFKL